jgi:hypothetical protein
MNISYKTLLVGKACIQNIALTANLRLLTALDTAE